MPLFNDFAFVSLNVLMVLPIVTLAIFVATRKPKKVPVLDDTFEPLYYDSATHLQEPTPQEEPPRRKTCDAGPTVMWTWLVGCLTVMCVLTQLLIWTDKDGEGNMFTLDGVLRLFRSSGDLWIVGIWGEILTYQLCIAILITLDFLQYRLNKIYTVCLLLASIFVGSIALVCHVVVRAVVLLCRRTERS